MWPPLAGSPWAVSPPGLPQIRTCPIKASGSSTRGSVMQRTSRRTADKPLKLSSKVTVTECRNHEVFPRFPPAASTGRHPLLSTGFPKDKFPGFSDTMECSDALLSLRPHFVSFAWPYLNVCSGFRSHHCRARQGRAWGWSPVSPSGRNVRRRQGLPGSWGTRGAFAWFFDPGGTDASRPLRWFGTAPGKLTTRATRG